MNITEYRAEYATFHSSLAAARYRYQAGFDSDLNTPELYDRFSDLFSRETIADLQIHLDRQPTHLETERAGLRNLLHSAQSQYVKSKNRELEHELSRCLTASRLDWNGEQFAVNDVPQLIAQLAKGDRRDELTTIWLDRISHCDDLRSELVQLSRDSARSLGFSSYAELAANSAGIELSQLQSA